MLTFENERTLTKFLLIGTAITTLIVVTGAVTDPVNAPKLLALGVTVSSSMAILLFKGFKQIFLGRKALFFVVAAFLFSAIIAVLASDSPISQNIYGVYGRNTGLLAYLFLALVLIVGSSLRDVRNISMIVFSLATVGVGNILYSLYVVAFGDPIGWNNPYGALLGTFGNPNFISSFLGITFSVLVALIGNEKLNKVSKILIALIALIAILLMPQTNSIQGYVVAAVGGSTVIFLRLRALKVKLFSWVFLAFVVVSSASSVLGIFQIGPLKTLLYQGTISFRGQYWQAAINMGLAKPLSGVGMDAYGDNYRLFRDAEALISPGVQVITNSAHNVILEQFASGGVLLLTSYIGILALTLASIIRVIRRSTEYDFVFAALVSGWLGYQLQSVISINQLGLAIWGWLLSGLIIAFDYQQVDKTWVTKSLKQSRNNLSSVRDGYVGAKLIGSLGAIVGALIASPPLASDYSWVKSTSTQNINVVVESLQPSYFKPSNVNRMVNAVALMEQNKLFDYSYSWAKKVIEFNPESFDAWRVLYSVKNASITDKAEALRNMKRLDPLNPNVESNP